MIAWQPFPYIMIKMNIFEFYVMFDRHDSDIVQGVGGEDGK